MSKRVVDGIADTNERLVQLLRVTIAQRYNSAMNGALTRGLES
jgi:hypothetical protein